MYDDGESFTAGDATAIHFDNDRLVALITAINEIFPAHQDRTLLRLAIMRTIYGQAEDR
jgi:hypothetical protein